MRLRQSRSRTALLLTTGEPAAPFAPKLPEDREEFKAILSVLSGTEWITATLLYGAGLRLMECMRLRVKHVDCGSNQI